MLYEVITLHSLGDKIATMISRGDQAGARQVLVNEVAPTLKEIRAIFADALDDADGDRAQLVPALGEGGSSGRPFEPRGDIRLENSYNFV